MLLAGALTLAIPILGWQSVKQLDASLQQTRIDAQTLRVANARVALAEADTLQAVLNTSDRDGTENLYAEQAVQPIFVDGYADDWQHQLASEKVFKHNGNTLSIRLAKRHHRLYLFLTVVDQSVVYHVPPTLKVDFAEGEQPDRQRQLINGDAVEVYIQSPEGRLTHALFRAIAPGPLNGIVASPGATTSQAGQDRFRSRSDVLGRHLPGYRGAWVSTANGFQLELDIPLPHLGSVLGVAFVDVESVNGPRLNSTGTMHYELMAQLHRNPADLPSSVPTLYYSPENAANPITPWVTPGVRARLFDRQGFLIADVNALYEKSPLQKELDPAKGSFFNAVLFRLFAYFVAGDSKLDVEPIVLNDDLHLKPDTIAAVGAKGLPTARYTTTERDRVLGSLVAIGGETPNGYLLFESNEELAASYASSRLARLFSLLTLVSILAGGVLFVYATMLSLRIRKLSKQASLAVADDGRVTGLPGSKARDEIGDLSRNLSALLARSANYTQYLEALSSRLSHELRTPLSVVKTSIENMDRDRLDSDSKELLDRASGGADQLGAIIRALVESTRLEQTVQNTAMVEMALDQWLRGSEARYTQVYPHMDFGLAVFNDSNQLRDQPLPSVPLVASPELLSQAFDKLVDNAVEFSTQKEITLVMALDGVGQERTKQRKVTLAVMNAGPVIPPETLTKLFDPMFSSRKPGGDRLHLGLGLYIVRMIAEAHGGKPIAKNLEESVLIGFTLPYDEK